MADDNTSTNLDSWTRRINVYGAIGVTIVVFGMFLFGMAVTAHSSDQTSFNNLLETTKALVMVAAGYWIGTSHNSTKKDDIIAHNAEMLASSVPVVKEGS